MNFTYLPQNIYQTIVENSPIICVDVMPVRYEHSWQIGLIMRATGPEKGKWAILGGRVAKNELINQAITRHLSVDLGVKKYSFNAVNSESAPFYIQQYQHRSSGGQLLGFDPTKHAIALTYLLRISQLPKPTKEASQFKWFGSDNIPKVMAYNQQLVVKKAFNKLI